ncbi:MAG: enoyl-CoA hydratase/isomerase family protein [Acidobacteria bacterium]|nr:enoyl-CoA hydratase/isomerase family protein [Acidobacteriota bacterium]
MAASDKLLVTLENGIKRITFNRPYRRNAADSETLALLRAAIEESGKDDSRVIILTGAGDAFCAGADLQVSDGHDIKTLNVTEELRASTNQTVLAMRALPKPILVRVHGSAAGVGCNYALAGDLIFASEEARFGQVFIKIGLAPDGGGTFFLPRVVGYARAFELMATGDLLSAQEAFSLGLINRVVPFAELDATVNQMAERLAAAPALALAMMKQGLQYGQQHDLAAALDNEAVNQGNCFRSADFAEGVQAFLEKRQANFQGK